MSKLTEEFIEHSVGKALSKEVISKVGLELEIANITDSTVSINFWIIDSDSKMKIIKLLTNPQPLRIRDTVKLLDIENFFNVTITNMDC